MVARTYLRNCNIEFTRIFILLIWLPGLNILENVALKNAYSTGVKRFKFFIQHTNRTKLTIYCAGKVRK